MTAPWPEPEPVTLTAKARYLTVTTDIGDREFADVTAEVAGGTLAVSRDGKPLSWFAPGQWTEAQFS